MQHQDPCSSRCFCQGHSCRSGAYLRLSCCAFEPVVWVINLSVQVWVHVTCFRFDIFEMNSIGEASGFSQSACTTTEVRWL
eukprot:m.921505 g.921505  ORF g.921505 m.921505 type:complete len:81 (+) comp85550_c0_seq1:69-311(+)